MRTSFNNNLGRMVILFCCLLFLLAPATAFSQGEKGEVKKETGTSGISPDSDKYLIGPGDVLSIQVWKEDHLSQTVMVRSDGRISLPLIDEIQAAGLTPLRLKEVLTQKIGQFVELPIITVMVREAKSFKVYIGGQVKNPGVYTLIEEISLLQLIPLAGGFTDWANQRKVLLIRKEGEKEKRYTINYKRIVSGQDIETNLMLKPGDTVIVPD
ncbi:MAG: polysaccharide biosynthesis/export family protein [Thermodesulfobacteriota bacterium]